MASRGAMVAGSSGADFEHREQVATQYQLSVVNKSRLRCSIFFHCALWLVMLGKLSADILDRLDVFILELEELQIPQPVWWEYVWLCSPLSALLALSGVRRNSVVRLRRYAGAVLALGVAPLLYCLLYYCMDLYAYLTADADDVDDLEIQMWQGVPVCGLWLVFVILGAQVHGFQLLFTHRLLSAWRARGQLRQKMQ